MKHTVSSAFAAVTGVAILLAFIAVAHPRYANPYTIQINLYTVVTFISIILNAVVIGMVLKTKSNHNAIKWFLLIGVTTMLGMTMLLLNSFSNYPEIGLYWDILAYTAWIPLGIAVFMFLLSYSRDEDKSDNPALFVCMLCFLIVTSFLMGGQNALGHTEVIEYHHRMWGYEVTKRSADYLDYPYIFILLLVIIGFVVLLLYAKKQTAGLAKKQLRIFNIAFIQLLVLSSIDIAWATGLATTFFGHEIPPMNPFYLSNMALLFGYGIWKYGIFRINPSSISGSILANMSEAVVATNDDFVIEFTNDSVTDITGYEQNSLKSEHLSILFNSSNFASLTDGVQNSAESFNIEETELKNKHGGLVPITLSASKVVQKDRMQGGYVFVFENITELKRKTHELAIEKANVEQKVLERTRELSQEHARLTASINSLTIGFFMTDINDRIVVINPMAVTILSKLADAQHLPMTEKWTMETVLKILSSDKDISELLKSGSKLDRTFEFKEVLVNERFIHVFIAPVIEDDASIGSVVVFEDITEEKALNRSKDEFFVLASHELRTPLTKIRTSAEVIQDVYKPDITSELALQMIQEIEHSSDHLIDIVNDFIEMSEFEQGKAHYDPLPHSIEKIVREFVEKFAEENKKDGVTFRFYMTTPDFQIVTDARRLQQVLFNLLSNARKFTSSGEILVEVNRRLNDVRIRVIDHGSGIRQENQSLLFRKFQQAGSSMLTRDGEGTGLGLYIAKLIVDQLGGRIGLESSDVGSGSVFYVDIPLKAAEIHGSQASL